VCIGSYTPELGGRGTGVTTYFYREDGLLDPMAELAMPSPSWLEWHPDRPILYCANELDEGSVSAVRVGRDGSMALLGTALTGGAFPCQLAVTSDGSYLLAANYGGGSTAVFALDADGGIGERTDLVDHRSLGLSPGPVADRQDGPHAHMVIVTGDLVVVVDLGLDALLSFRLDDAGRLQFRSASPVSPGTGPRQLVRRAGTGSGLVLGELAGSLTVVDETAPGVFSEAGSVAASGRAGVVQSAQLSVGPDGTWALVSNRQVDTVALFDLTGAVPQLIDEYPVGPGWPRHFGIVGHHVYVGNQHAHELIVFALDPDSGRLTREGAIPIGSPVCIASRRLAELAPA
jgi:6-phosphogluconolactonase (cycloisomerase 2 family)